MRLLIVEDSALIRKLAQLAFPPQAYQIEEAANGLEGLTRLANARQPFDAIILDLQMPDMNGVEFLRALQQRPQHRDTPVVIATSEGETSPLLAEARRLGVAAVVKKPWQPHAMAELFRRPRRGADLPPTMRRRRRACPSDPPTKTCGCWAWPSTGTPTVRPMPGARTSRRWWGFSGGCETGGCSGSRKGALCGVSAAAI